MPPAAALECDLTGWTFDMIATVAPSRAAARAARWPARPAPMIRTSCAGICRPVYLPRRLACRTPHPGQLEQHLGEVAARARVRRVDLPRDLRTVQRRAVAREQ